MGTVTIVFPMPVRTRSSARAKTLKPKPPDSPAPDRPIKREVLSRSMSPHNGNRTISVKRESENKPPLDLNLLRGNRKRKRNSGPLPKTLWPENSRNDCFSPQLVQRIKDQASKADILGPTSTMIPGRVRPIEPKSESLVAPKSISRSPAPQKPRSRGGGLDVLLEAIEQESKSKPPPALERVSDKSVRSGFDNVSVKHDLEKSGRV